ncbi:hypothetical protein M427DRAFT_70180 [Gonapodya prolifera JEL478]|uniref:Uncharacterized protein n=1 Tax=Gonapodya prolifera (strain JEL478) TaxID=1344416 RepID=A0A139AF89_GONPJ|nr:hypothetical protein M427DRAFT_70180 [Gonapodya prolifera JEL478]|eukprot:KXS15083.1 hypothetical protein M427DRAFT_70180 [Gonapodya prolifera JEL478]
MVLFHGRRGALDWARVLEFDCERVEEHIDLDAVGASLDPIYDALAHASISLDDPQATRDNLVKLFRVAQSLLQYKHALFQETDAEAERLDLEVRTLEASGAGVDPTYRSLRDESALLSRHLREAQQCADRAERALEQEKARSDATEMDAQAHRARAQQLAQQLERASADAKDVSLQVQAHRDAVARARVDEGELRQAIREKNAEVNRLLNEVNVVQARNAELEREVESMGQELEAAVGELESKTRDQHDTHAALLSADTALDTLRAERDALKARAEDLEGVLREKGLKVETELEEIGGELMEYKHKVSASRLELSNRETRITVLQAEIADLRAQLEAKEWDRLQRDVMERDETIKTLRAQVERAERDFEVLAEEWESAEGKLKDAEGRLSMVSPDRSALHLRAATKLRERVKLLQQRRRADTARIADLEDRLASMEGELAQTRARCERVESGTYGMPEARKEIRELEVHKALRDKDIARLATEANAYRTKAEDLAEECDALRARLGLPEVDKAFADGTRMARYAELEELRMVNVTLRKEVDALEEERIKLKSQLRVRAVEVAGRAAEAGLSGEEMMEVEEYAESLRRGEVTSGHATSSRSDRPTDRPHIENQQLDRLAYQLERAALDLQEERDARRAAEETLFRRSEEHRLAGEALRELGKTFVEGRERGVEGVDVVERLVALLDRDRENGFGVVNGRTGGESAGDSVAATELLRVNRVLRDEVQQLKKSLEDTALERSKMEKRLTELGKELESSRLEARRPRKKVEEMAVELSVGSLYDVAELVDQLVTALREIEEKDKDHRRLGPTLKGHFEQLATMCHQLRLLYKDFQVKQSEWDAKNKNLASKLAEANDALEASRVKIIELERTMNALADSTSDNAKSRFSELARRNAVLAVSEQGVTRRCKALEAELVLVDADRKRLREDMSAVEVAARQTIGRMERKRKEMAFRIDQLEQEIKDSIKMDDYLAMRSKTESLEQKYKNMLERETQWIADNNRLDVAGLDIGKAILMKAELTQAIRDCADAERRLEDLSAVLEGTSTDNAKAMTPADLQRRVALLSAQLESNKACLERAERKVQTARDAEEQVRKRLEEVESKLFELVKERSEKDEAFKALQEQVETCVKRSDHEEIITHLAEARSRIIGLESDVSHYKDTVAIAAMQTTDFQHFHSINVTELELLRGAVRELQMEGDEKLIIGNLHQKIVSLQSSEVTLQKKLKEENERNLKLAKRVAEREFAQSQESQTKTAAELKIATATITSLEEKLAMLEADFEIKQIEWARAEFDLEKDTVNVNEERGVHRGVSFDDMVSTDTRVSTEGHLEAFDQRLASKDRLLKDMETKIAMLETTIRDIRAQPQSDDITKSAQISKVAAPTREEDSTSEVAQLTIDALQRQLDQKEEMLKKYQDMLTTQNNSWEQQKELDQMEIRRLSTLVTDLNQRALSHLQSRPEDSTKKIEREASTLEQELRTLESILESREREVETMSEKCKKLEEEVAAQKLTLDELLRKNLEKDLQDEGERKRLNLRIVGLESDLLVARNDAKRSPAKSNVELVKHLKMELAKKTAVEGKFL